MTGWAGGVPNPLNVIPIGSTQVPGDTATPDPVLSDYGEALAVLSGVETVIVTHVVPASPIQHVLRVEFSGTNIGFYRLYFGATRVHQTALWWTSGFNGSWEFRNPGGGGLLLPASSVIQVRILHHSPQVGDFYARFQYIDVE
jgi:hypothetical protein